MLRAYAPKRSWLLGAIHTMIFTLLLAGCMTSPPLTKDMDDQTEMKAVLLRAIPLGSSLTHAQQFMQQEAFECMVITNGNLVEQGHVASHIDYLYCGRRDRTDIFLTQRWQIALVHQNERIIDVRVSMRLD